jgi:hypothetical protein
MPPTSRPTSRTERKPDAPKGDKDNAQRERKSSEKRRTPADKKLAANIANMYQGAGAAVAGLGMARQDIGLVGSGSALIEQSEAISEAWLDLCDSNPKVKQVLIRMTEVSSVGVLVGLHVSVAIPVLVTRGIIPEQFASAAQQAATANAAAAAANANGGNPNSSN